MADKVDDDAADDEEGLLAETKRREMSILASVFGHVKDLHSSLFLAMSKIFILLIVESELYVV